MQEFGAVVITPSKYRYAKLALAFALALFASADCAYWERCTPQPRAIFSGITYGCELLERTEEGHGVLHWVRVELRAPGIELYVTPLDPSALEGGFQYRLRWIDDVVRNERPCSRHQWGLFTSKPRLATGIARGSRKGGGDRCFGPRDEPFLGTHLSAVVRRCI